MGFEATQRTLKVKAGTPPKLYPGTSGLAGGTSLA
jgi:hypothetical protein